MPRYRLEATHLELHGNQAVESSMEEEQIQSEVSVTYLKRLFGAHEAEVAAKLK